MTSSSTSNSPRVFLSYTSEDAKSAERLRPLLKLAGFGPWLDSEALSTEQPWEEAMERAIASSDFVVALLSRGTRNSRQEHELRAAVSGSHDRKPLVLSCAITGTRNAGFDEIAPDFLRESHVLDFADFDAGWQRLYESLYRAARLDGVWLPRLLRAVPRRDLDHAAVSRMIVKQGFYSRSMNRRGGADESQLSLAPGGVVVEDRSSGRMWTKMHLPSSNLPQAPQSSAEEMTAEMFPASMRSDEQKALVEARRDMKLRMRLTIEEWLKRVNFERLGGYDDWRLPTLEEAMSLMSSDIRRGGLYLSELFSDSECIRTSDGSPGAQFLDPSGEVELGWGPVWVVMYADGDCYEVPEEAPISLRFVRTDLD